MAESVGQPLPGEFSASDEMLRDYLLCRLGEEERLRLDQRLLVDDEFAERVLLAESELTDDYTAGRLDSIGSTQFEKNFLTTDLRRKKLDFASALHAYAGSQTSSARDASVAGQNVSSWQKGLAGLFGFGRSPVWALAGSLAGLFVLVGLAWFAVSQLRTTAPEISGSEPVPASSPLITSPAEVPSPVAIVSPQPPPASPNKAGATPTASRPVAPAAVASFVLLPGAIRDGGNLQRVTVPDGEHDTVRLNLVLEAGSEGDYQAEVATAEGQKVAIRGKLKAHKRNGDETLTIDIPARLLKRGDYQIKLNRHKAGGQLESVGRYYFRALD